MKRLALLALSVVVEAGCTHVEPLTVAPPGRSADVDGDKHSIVLSRGVAVAFSCTTAWGHRCSETASVDDAKVARVYPAHLERLEWFSDGKFKPTSFVLVGLNPGATTLRIHDEPPFRITVKE